VQRVDDGGCELAMLVPVFRVLARDLRDALRSIGQCRIVRAGHVVLLRHGRRQRPNDVPAFGAIYSPEDSQDVAAYILETLTSEQSNAAPAR
jgi:hypothetical protein